jgi:hypothetical protein
MKTYFILELFEAPAADLLLIKRMACLQIVFEDW